MYINNVCRRLIFIFLLVLTQKSTAEVQLGLSYGSLQNSNNGTNISSVDRATLDGFVSVSLNRANSFFLNVGYLQVDHVENFLDGTYESTTSTNPYVGVGYLFRNRNFPIGLELSVAYSPSAKLTISQTAGSEKWDGSAILAKTGFNVQVSRRINLGVSVMYVAETYNQKVSGSLTGRSALEQSYFAPCLGFGLSF